MQWAVDGAKLDLASDRDAAEAADRDLHTVRTRGGLRPPLLLKRPLLLRPPLKQLLPLRPTSQPFRNQT